MRAALALALLAAACDRSAPARSSDAAVIFDLAMQLAPLDLGAPDFADGAVALPCGGGFLNGGGCPLACDPAVRAIPDEGRTHVVFGTPVAYVADPPASGPHWPFPAPWGIHVEVVPREWWVHNLEHGGIVLLYNCPDGDAGTDGGVPNACPDVVAALAAFYNAWPPTPITDAFSETKILVTADPRLPGRVAAVAWDWSYVAGAVDGAALDCFAHARYGRGPEDAP